MKIAEVKVAKTTCETTLLVPIPKGIVGATISIEYTDPAWDGLQKTVVFRSSVTKDVLSSGNEVVIPAEVVSRAGRNLYMGVYGVDAANNVVIPTIWAELGMIHSAADPSGDASSDPALPVWAQIQAMIDAITTSKVSVVDIVNDLATNVADRPLSAAQGVALRGLIDELRTLIPEAYTLPVATETVLGGVKPVTATEAMTQPVGVDAEGRLMTKPGSVGSGIAVSGATVGQTIKIAAVDDGGVPTAWEAVDFPSGGGGTMELFATVPVEEEVVAVVIDLPDEWDELFVSTNKNNTLGIGQKVSANAGLDFVFDNTILRTVGTLITTNERQNVQLYVKKFTWGLLCFLGAGANNAGSFTMRSNGHAFILNDNLGANGAKQLKISVNTNGVTFMPTFSFYVYAR